MFVRKRNLGVGIIRIQYLRGFFCANVHFKAKPSKVVGEDIDPSFDVGPGFKSKCVVIYIEHT